MTVRGSLLLLSVATLAVVACNAAFRFDEEPDDDSPVAGSASRDGGVPGPCTSDLSCGSAGLHCAKDSGACYACLTDGDCPSGASGATRCDPQSNRCVECLRDTDCANGSVCEATRRRCLQQCHDMDDSSRCLPAGSTCSASRRVCVACLTNADCATSTSGPLCDTMGGRCVACLDDSSCAAPASRCDLLRGVCAACTGPKDCPASAPICDTRTYACTAPK